MRKNSLLIIILLAFNSLFANPVDFDRAKMLGQKFVDANFKQKTNALDLVYTMNSESGEACFYVFNTSNGFVMVSAEDFARPILGYSEESIFDVNNIAPGLDDMMAAYQVAISHGMTINATATPDIASEWKALESSGKVKPAMRGRSVEPLCTTKWNQSWPYNKFCPEQSASWSSNGHVVVGCVATAMAQVMKFWDYPTQGTGSHSYNAPMYGQQSVNFGETTYDWDNMPDRIDAASPVEQIDAVALLSYHCGVSVDMHYDTNGEGSGTSSSIVPHAIQSYFGYAPCTLTYRDGTPDWEMKLMDSFDKGFPVYYSGFDEENRGHAFVCDGYDENGLFHFNFGWGGSGDGYFSTSAMEYHVSSSAIFDFIPVEIYNNVAQAPSNFTVTPADNNELAATLSWTNPAQLVNEEDISLIDKIVIERNGVVIHEETNVTPGTAMTFVDENVPCYSYFTYKIYAVVNGVHGDISRVEEVQFGPTCDWKMLLQVSAFNGMRGASISAYDAAGIEFMRETTTNSSLKTIDIAMPLGDVQFVWNPVSAGQSAYTTTIIIKDSNNKTVFNYTGSTDDIQTGVFFTANNNCGITEEIDIDDIPTNLSSTVENGTIVLTWDCEGNPDYGYNIYRDGLLIALSKEKTFVDDDVPYGGHCYTVTGLYNYGNTPHSNEVCGVTTEDCEPARNLWYEYTAADKIKITWDAPANDEGLSGYYIMRKTSEDNEWKRVKVLGANKNDYTDTGANDDNLIYSYRVLAYYQDIDCLSSPAKARYGNEYMINVSTPTGLEDAQSQSLRLYPNPVDDNLKIEADEINSVTIFNLMGQKVYESNVDSDEVLIDMSSFQSGIYMIQIETVEYKVTKRISVSH